MKKVCLPAILRGRLQSRKEQGLDDFSLVSIAVVKESLTTAIDGKKYSRKGAKAQREGLFDFISFRSLLLKKISLFLCVLPAVGRLCAFAREKKSY